VFVRVSLPEGGLAFDAAARSTAVKRGQHDTRQPVIQVQATARGLANIGSSSGLPQHSRYIASRFVNVVMTGTGPWMFSS
jgi:hypothetical protein